MAKPARRTPVPATAASALLLSALAVGAGASTARAAGPAEPNAPAERGLLARWRFDPSHLQGNAFAPLAGKLTAKVVGPVRFTGGPEALLLDGNSKAGHRLDVTDDLAAAGLPDREITVEAWVMLDKTPRWGAFVGAFQDNGDYERGWLLGHAGPQFCFAVAGEGPGSLTYLQAPAPLQTGYWYHVAGTYDGAVQRLYVDGRLVASRQEQSGPIAYPPKAFYTIGAYRDGNELYTMAGRIEQVSVYARALGPAEVRARFDARKGLFPAIEPPAPSPDEDWPTYLHDNHRSGASPRELPLPLHLAWVHRPRHAPAPAWPPPARQDYWHRRFNLEPRVVYDRAFHATAAGDRLYFASSAEDKVTCLDAATGRAIWSFFAEGPVRLAPTIAGERVLFGSDDGWAYCLAAKDGALLWKQRAGPADRRIPGNERIISMFPVRTDVLVADGAAMFCAGLFPLQGVYQARVDVETGRLLAAEQIKASTQGYQLHEHERLLAPTGRDPKGAVLSPQRRRGKFTAAGIAVPDCPYARIWAGSVLIGGGDDQVVAFDAEAGRALWSARVEGRAYGLALARGRLVVSTDRGMVFCFTPRAPAGGAAAFVEPPPPADVPCDDAGLAGRCAEAAQRVVRESGVARGYCLVLGPAPARLAAELAARSEMQIVLRQADAKAVAAARATLDAAGLYGRRVAVHHGPAEDLPYADCVFNVVVSGQAVIGGRFAGRRDEAMRVLVPGRGFAFLDGGEQGPSRREPRPGGGEWTHLWGDAGNTACSGDTIIEGPLAIQWFGQPGPRDMLDRHHRNASPLCRDGRLFVPGDQVIYAVDAHNGTILWQADVPESRRLGVFLDCGAMALDDEVLYVAAADKCRVLDVRSGKERPALAMPQSVPGQRSLWGLVARGGELLVGSGRKPSATYTETSWEADNALWYDNMQLVTSDYLFAAAGRGGAGRWTYRSGVIINPTITLGNGRAYFVESHSPQALADTLGRMTMQTFLPGPNYLVALDLATGKPAWKRPIDLSNCQHIVYLSHARGMLVLSGNRYVDKQLWYWFYGIDAADGADRWERSHNAGFKPGGGHGEQNRHPVIVGGTVYAEPLAYDLRTGEPVNGWKFSRHGHGCGNLSASASRLFWRGANPWMWDLRPGGGPARLNTVSRPGCFINIIPACGLVLIPEASSGCTCNYPLQTSIVYAPTGPPTPPVGAAPHGPAEAQP